MKLRHFFPCLLLAGLAVTAASCSDEATLPSGQGRNVTMTVNISRVGDSTRSVLAEQEGDLKCTWETNDLILVVDNAGNKLGVLKLTDGADEATATFKGEITTDAVGETGVKFLYLGRKSEEDLQSLATPVSIDYSAQDGTLAWLSANDFFSGAATVDIANSYVNVDGVSLARQIAFGRFEMQLPEGVTYGGEDITVSGPGLYTKASVSAADGNAAFTENGTITINLQENETPAEFYMTVLPTSEKITPTFSVTIDGTEYSCTLGERLWTPSEFVRKANEDASYSGIALAMAAPAGDEIDDDDLVGPVITLSNGKKYRFVKGNLYCDILDKDNYTWHLYDKETYYQQKTGTSSYFTNGSYTSLVRQINGTGTNTGAGAANINENNKYIDLFPWGATGLGSGINKARVPDIVRSHGNPQSAYSGTYFPSENNSSGAQCNMYITNLWNTYGFNEPVYDFGYAYMQNGRPEGDNRTYVTPPLDAYAYICDQSRSFSQGCVVKNAGYDGSDAYGALILFGITSKDDAEAAIKAVNGTVDTDFCTLTPNMNDSKFSFSIHLPDYECIQAFNELKEINGKQVEIQAMFFACGGEAIFNVSNKKADISSTTGTYWTCNAPQGSSTSSNGYGFFFRKAKTAFEFCWIIGKSGVSQGRQYQRSVRLMVEVDD